MARGASRLFETTAWPGGTRCLPLSPSETAGRQLMAETGRWDSFAARPEQRDVPAKGGGLGEQ